MDYTGAVSSGGGVFMPIDQPHATGSNTSGSEGEYLLEGLKAGLDYRFHVVAYTNSDIFPRVPGRQPNLVATVAQLPQFAS